MSAERQTAYNARKALSQFGRAIDALAQSLACDAAGMPDSAARQRNNARAVVKLAVSFLGPEEPQT